MIRARKFVFTINNFTQGDVDRILGLNCTACVCAREVGAGGTRHLQGAVVFADAKSFSAVQKRLRPPGSPGCFTEVMKGTWTKQLVYCGKGSQSHAEYELDGINGAHYGQNVDIVRQDAYVERPGQGARTDIVPFRDAIKRGSSDLELIDEHPMMVAKFPRFIGTVRNAVAAESVVQLPPGSKRLGMWIWSRDGDMGKTSWVMDRFPQVFEKSSNKWWDGYSGQKVVLIDDPSPMWASHLMSYLKNWCNEKPFIGEVKGTYMHVRFEQIYVCCNTPPDEYFGAHFAPSPFYARFKVCEVEKMFIDSGMPSRVFSF